MGANQKGVQWGKIQGSVKVPTELLAQAQDAGQAAFKRAEAEEFCGDEVAWLPDAPWHQTCESLFPVEAVRHLGYELAEKGQFRVYSTPGTDPHIDGEGVAFVLVLSNGPSTSEGPLC